MKKSGTQSPWSMKPQNPDEKITVNQREQKVWPIAGSLSEKRRGTEHATVMEDWIPVIDRWRAKYDCPEWSSMKVTIYRIIRALKRPPWHTKTGGYTRYAVDTDYADTDCSYEFNAFWETNKIGEVLPPDERDLALTALKPRGYDFTPEDFAQLLYSIQFLIGKFFA